MSETTEISSKTQLLAFAGLFLFLFSPLHPAVSSWTRANGAQLGGGAHPWRWEGGPAGRRAAGRFPGPAQGQPLLPSRLVALPRPRLPGASPRRLSLRLPVAKQLKNWKSCFIWPPRGSWGNPVCATWEGIVGATGRIHFGLTFKGTCQQPPCSFLTRPQRPA